MDILTAYGYVTLIVVDGSAENMLITSTHLGVAGIYQVDEEGHLSEQ